MKCEKLCYFIIRLSTASEGHTVLTQELVLFSRVIQFFDSRGRNRWLLIIDLCSEFLSWLELGTPYLIECEGLEC